VAELLGMYRALFESMHIGLPPGFPFVVAGTFSHPIEEANQMLTSEFMETSRILQQLCRDKVNVQLVDARVNPSIVNFIFSYKEATDNEHTPPPA